MVFIYSLSNYLFKSALPVLRQFLPTEMSLKVMKKVFYFALKTLFVLKILKILPYFLGFVENILIRKLRLILKSMTSQNGKQAFTIQILLNVSRSKGSQIRKFGQLKEHNERNFFFFLKNRTQKVVEKLVPHSFIKLQN